MDGNTRGSFEQLVGGPLNSDRLDERVGIARAASPIQSPLIIDTTTVKAINSDSIPLSSKRLLHSPLSGGSPHSPSKQGHLRHQSVSGPPAVDWIGVADLAASSPLNGGGVATSLDIRVGSDGCFRDQFSRSLWFRGVNICAKIPTHHHRQSDHHDIFFEKPAEVSFVDEPFPLVECDEHFTRLKLWGLTFIRLGVTWEALEHSGPGQYDEQYIAFVVAVCRQAEEHGLRVIIDPHQDTWSRYSGGSGAPFWTFTAVGMDPRKFRATGAAYVHTWNPTVQERMLWPTNYSKISSQTMFTLFFAGNVFAPKSQVDGQSVQDYLQRLYIACFANLMRHLKDCRAVIGIEIMNEPHSGYIGIETLEKYDYDKHLHLGPSPTALQSFALGSGLTQDVAVYARSFPYPTRKVGITKMNPQRETHWSPAGCIWRQHGVWDIRIVDGVEQAVILRKDYFHHDSRTGMPYNFNQDFYLPFVRSFSTAMRAVNEKLLILVEPIPNEDPPLLTSAAECQDLGLGSSLVFAPHWYDLSMLFTKSFSGIMTHNVQELSRGSRNIVKHTYLGVAGMRANYFKQISKIIRVGQRHFGPALEANVPAATVPVIFGECGIPMDMNEHHLSNSNDYKLHNLALDAMIQSMERAKVSGFTLWNYNPQNEHAFGDSWNGEDFSIYSKTIVDRHRKSLRPHWSWYVGGRGLEAIIRPFAAKLAGDLISANFSWKRRVYKLHFRSHSTYGQVGASSDILRQTEVYVPEYHYGDPNVVKNHFMYDNVEITVSDGEYHYDYERQTLFYWHSDDVIEHTLTIRPKSVTSFLLMNSSFSPRTIRLAAIVTCTLTLIGSLYLIHVMH
eukprot:Partr_v1_DN27943_c0_g1_i1_m11403 putative Cellulase (glycosyl hydrolase family 5)